MSSTAPERHEPSRRELPVAELMERLASRQAAPGGGAAVALTVASGAALAAMAARLAGRRIPDAGLVVQQMDALRRHVLTLMERDAAAYGRVLEAPPEGRAAALAAACEVPVALAEAGAEITEAAVRLSLQGNPRLAADAGAGALLPESGVRTALSLVRDNLAGMPGREGRLGYAERLAGRASEALSRLVSGEDHDA